MNPTQMETVSLAVNGTLMRGLALNANMTLVEAEFVREALTESSYRLWSIDDRHPAMLRVSTDGVRSRSKFGPFPPVKWRTCCC